MNRLFVTLILLYVSVHSGYSASQCYQCAHSETDQNIDCVNADLKYLKNCIDDNQTINDWSCRQEFNFTTTSLITVARICIPRLFTSGCTSTGNSYASFMTCVCDTDGCNGFVLEVEDETTTVQSTITDEETTELTTIGDLTTVADNGNASLKFPSILLTCCLVVFSLRYNFVKSNNLNV